MDVRELVISKGLSRKDTKWKNIKVSWSKLVNKLATTTRTPETMKEFLSLKKDKQDEIKDIGGFVGGELTEGRRRKGGVAYRDILTLDMDEVPGEFDVEFDLFYKIPYAAAVYSTHKHKQNKPRLRLLLPLSRQAKADEYEAVGRYVASIIGIDYFDDTTFQPERLMYWPSTSVDAEYLFQVSEEENWLDVDEVLKSYANWTDISSWAYSSRVSADSIRKTADVQQDPRLKEGIVGVFCRTYTITEAINEFLSDIYQETDIPGRYTYTKGTSSGGAIVYNDLFLYSHHSTDPCSMKLVNAWDLVRVHKFGDKDKEAKDDTPINRLPSSTTMREWANNIDRVKAELVKSHINLEASIEDFDVIDTEDTESQNDDWIRTLEIGNKNTGELKCCINNFLVIMENDPYLKKLGRNNLFMDRFEVESAPWKRVATKYWDDADESALRHYIEKTYHIEGMGKIIDAFNIYCQRHSYHPVKDYLEKQIWDGTPRAESLLIDFLGADDNLYVREVTRKTLTAAIKRIYIPGCKFDQMLVLVGPQGNGKSTLCQKLGREWFSDSLFDMKGKDGYEALDGVWIMEIGELACAKKVDRDTLKGFISKREDKYRKAYARNTTNNPRTCIFIGSTNEYDFLNDPTGSRRFWAVDCHANYKKSKNPCKHNVWHDLTQDYIDQVWAEVMEWYTLGEDNVMELSDAAMEICNTVADEHQMVSDNKGIIEKYLDILLPKSWAAKDPIERKEYIQSVFNEDEMTELGTEKRMKITIVECKKELGNLLSGVGANGDFVLNREISDILNNSEDWDKVNSMRTQFGMQRGWKRKE